MVYCQCQHLNFQKKKKSELWKTHICRCELDSVPIFKKTFLIILVVILLTNLFFNIV